MNPTFRRFWVIGFIFSSVIDIITTYLILRKDLFIVTIEKSPLYNPLINIFGAEIALFVIGPLVIGGFIWTTLYVCDKYWPFQKSILAKIEIIGSYILLSLLLGIKFFVAALNTVSVLKLREII